MLTRILLLGLVAAGCAMPSTVHAKTAQTIHATTVTYGSLDNENMTIYSADNKTHPTILYVHGGGFARAAANSTEIDFAKDLVTQSGWNVALVNYPVDVPPLFNTEIGAIHDALVNLDGQPLAGAHIYLWGESAGGNLALMATYNHPGLVDSVVSISGPTDLITQYDTTPTLVVPYEGGENPTDSFAAGQTRYFDTSPVYAANATAQRPTFQAIGADDFIVKSDQVDELNSVLTYYGVTHKSYTVAGTSDHATALESDTVSGQTVEQLGITYLVNHTR